MEWKVSLRPELDLPFRISELQNGLHVEAVDAQMAQQARNQLEVALAAGHLQGFLGEAPRPLRFRALWIEGSALPETWAERAAFCGFNMVIAEGTAGSQVNFGVRLVSADRYVQCERPEADGIPPERILAQSSSGKEERLFVLRSADVVEWIEEILIDAPTGTVMAFDAQQLTALWSALRKLVSPSETPLVPVFPVDGEVASYQARMGAYPFYGAVFRTPELPDPRSGAGRELWVAGQILWRRLNALLLSETHAAAFNRD